MGAVQSDRSWAVPVTEETKREVERIFDQAGCKWWADGFWYEGYGYLPGVSSIGIRPKLGIISGREVINKGMMPGSGMDVMGPGYYAFVIEDGIVADMRGPFRTITEAQGECSRWYLEDYESAFQWVLEMAAEDRKCNRQDWWYGLCSLFLRPEKDIGVGRWIRALFALLFGQRKPGNWRFYQAAVYDDDQRHWCALDISPPHEPLAWAMTNHDDGY